MLVLFDIDGTLLRSDRAGTRAMIDAGREMFGESFTLEGVEIAGRLDPQIWLEAAARNGIGRPHEHGVAYRQTYARLLAARLAEHPTVELLPGVAALIERLDATEGVALGLLTGNYPETGRMKIEAGGLDPDIFTVAAWGCDGASRRELPAVAMSRHAETSGAAIEAREVVIIGDTPHDVDCAHAHGCRSIAVATGVCGLDDLRPAGADLLVADLADVERIMQWLAPAAAGCARELPHLE